MITLFAKAKINLCLDVVGRLPNGYHEVRMIMQTVGISDKLTFEKTEGEIRITTNKGELPLGEDNLIYKAAALMKETYGISGGVSVALEKHIPIAAGMAGGSTDAAATLKAMNELYELGLSEEELRKLGVKLGADGPYCVMGGTALSEGIGEVLCVLLVAKPDINVSTKYVYETLDSKEIPVHPKVDEMIGRIEEGDVRGVAALLGNVLENVTVERYKVVDEIKQVMLRGGAQGSLMSGSGPSVFGIFERADLAQTAAEEIRRLGLANEVFVTQPE